MPCQPPPFTPSYLRTRRFPVHYSSFFQALPSRGRLVRKRGYDQRDSSSKAVREPNGVLARNADACRCVPAARTTYQSGAFVTAAMENQALCLRIKYSVIARERTRKRLPPGYITVSAPQILYHLSRATQVFVASDVVLLSRTSRRRAGHGVYSFGEVKVVRPTRDLPNATRC